MADRPDFHTGFWHNLGPTANDRLTDIWENAPSPGETVKVTVGPMTHLTWTLVCVIAQGMIFKRNSLDGVVYLAKQEAQFRWYNVAFRTRAEAEVTSLSGDVLAVIPVFPLMHWEELRSNFAEMLQITKWEVRLVYGLQFIGQRNMKRPISSVVLSEDQYTLMQSTPAMAKSKAKAKAQPKPKPQAKAKAKAKAKVQVRRPAAVQHRPAALRRPAAAA